MVMYFNIIFIIAVLMGGKAGTGIRGEKERGRES